MRFCIYLIIILCSPLLCMGQQPGYVHYSVRSGLAGSTVYHICQDKEGFIWMGTNAGLSRYDGTRFVNFTMADGLPDNEVIFLFADSQGRVWISSFKKEICYYYRGKVYTRKQDPLLEKIIPKNIIANIYEDQHGDVCLSGNMDFIRITPSRQVIVQTPPKKPISIPAPRNAAWYRALCSDKYIAYSDHTDSLWIYSLPDTKLRRLRLMSPLIKVSVANDSVLYINTISGAYVYNFYQNRMIGMYMKDQTVGCSFRDHHGDMWFATIENGVYQMNNLWARNCLLKDKLGYDRSIYCLGMVGSVVHAASEKIWQVQEGKGWAEMHLKHYPVTDSTSLNQDKILHFTYRPDGHMVCASNVSLIDADVHTKKVHHSYSGAIKDVWELDDSRWLIADASKACIFNHRTWQSERTVWPTRTTAIAARHDSIFIGTLEGLYLVKGSVSTYLGRCGAVLQKRISKIGFSADGSVWIATYGYGVVQWRNGRIVRHLTTTQGLSSDICSTLTVYKNTVWVATDRGVNRIQYNALDFVIDVFNSYSGLGSDYVNAVLVHNDQVYIGTSVGITSFPYLTPSTQYKPRLVFIGAQVENEEVMLASKYVFSYPKNRNLRFNFTGISYNQGAAIKYLYQLEGLDQKWHTTTQPFLEYTSLPAGAYVLRVVASSGFKRQSNRICIYFEVVPPFWQQWWFPWLVGLALVMAATGLIYLRFQYLQKKTQEEGRMTRYVLELKHRALKAQMNPHFIFNCLSAIQQFLFSGDRERSNKYLTTLSRVIRQTLELTSQNSIPIQAEIDYLTNYLKLEQMRFDYGFDYQIHLDALCTSSDVHIPSMVIQPYVENSIRHGIRYQKGLRGLVEVRVIQSDTVLTITITDNGVGREKAKSYKSNQHIEYQSQGTTLTHERIEILNQNYACAQKSGVVITDVYNDAQQCIGTQVTITFPLEILNKLTYDTSLAH